MKTSTALWVVVVLLIIVGGWYWYSMNGTPAGNQSPTPSPSPVANVISLGVSTASSSSFLTASNGMTLYTFDKDSVGSTTCYATCAEQWPPYVVAPQTTLQAPNGAAGQAATISRADGGQQVTYNGMPLYFFAADTATGDIKGNGIGKVWHLVKP